MVDFWLVCRESDIQICSPDEPWDRSIIRKYINHCKPNCLKNYLFRSSRFHYWYHIFECSLSRRCLMNFNSGYNRSPLSGSWRHKGAVKKITRKWSIHDLIEIDSTTVWSVLWYLTTRENNIFIFKKQGSPRVDKDRIARILVVESVSLMILFDIQTILILIFEWSARIWMCSSYVTSIRYSRLLSWSHNRKFRWKQEISRHKLILTNEELRLNTQHINWIPVSQKVVNREIDQDWAYIRYLRSCPYIRI